MKLKIGIDIDNTVSDTIETWMSFTEIILKEKGITPKRIYGIFSTADAYGIKRGSELHNYVKLKNQELNKTNWKDYKLIKDAKENLIKLKSLGYSLIFISARNDEYFGNAYKISKDWMDYVGIPYDKIICNCEDKGLACKNEGINVLIDDGLRYCEMAVKNGCKAIYFDDENQKTKQSGANNNENIFVCKNWNEIYNQILSFTKEEDNEKTDLRY